MNKYTTTQEFLENTIALLNDQLSELETWSIHNGDKGLDEISDFQERFEELAVVLKASSKEDVERDLDLYDLEKYEEEERGIH